MTRGFPESTFSPPGPKYPARTRSDYVKIASVIRDLKLRILVLEEIYAEQGAQRSKELDRLTEILGSENYDYLLGQTGGSQRIAILYDRRYARPLSSLECDFENIRVEGKALFEREPLIARFRLFNSGEERNDLVIVGVHLSSGQESAGNHDRAMRMIGRKIAELRQEGALIPGDENDILIAGDFNCNRFDSKVEKFWGEMESGGWSVLAKNKETYPATRLSGRPLGLHDSRIDYLIATKGRRGLDGEEINALEATVHTELIEAADPRSCESFRRHASDHLPVTVTVRVMEDTDGK